MMRLFFLTITHTVGNDGRKTAFGEIDLTDGLAASLQDLAQRKIDRLKTRFE